MFWKVSIESQRELGRNRQDAEALFGKSRVARMQDGRADL